MTNEILLNQYKSYLHIFEYFIKNELVIPESTLKNFDDLEKELIKRKLIKERCFLIYNA